MNEIIYPKDEKFESALVCAMSHPTFFEGLEWLVAWEHERECKARDRAKGEAYDNMFPHVIRVFRDRWMLAGRPLDWPPAQFFKI